MSEDKNITINDTKYNFFKFFNIEQPLTDIKYFNAKRLVFTKPVAKKLPNNIPFYRIFIAITGPKTRTINENLKNVYDVNELLDYDSSIETAEFSNKFNLDSLKKDEYHILINCDWYKKHVNPTINEPSFIYNIDETLYDDEEPSYKESILSKFMVFDGTELYKKKKEELPPNQHHILLNKSWLKSNLSDEYLKTMKEEYKPLVFPSGEVFSFGVTKNTLDTSGDSYQISLCLYDRKNPTNEEIKWAAKYEELAHTCREYLKKNEAKKFKGQTLKGLSWKKDDVLDSDGPKLYPKVMYNQKKKEFITVFMDENDKDIEDPLNILDKKAKIKAALRFESIFIGSKVALQVRTNDVLIINWIEAYKPRPLIVRTKVLEENNDSNDESDFNSDEEEVSSKSPVKRNIKTVAKMTTN